MECNLGWNHTCDFKIERALDLKSQVWFQTKTARHEAQLPLYYTYFEIAQLKELVSSNILLMQYWTGLKFNSSIFWEEKVRVLETKVAKCAIWYSCLSFSCNVIGYFKQALNLIGCFVFSVASSLARKKMRFKAKNSAIRE